jgi:ectoine hydroxylase-related dioxygenase (phytanoyl-CoA dioxygenase family)
MDGERAQAPPSAETFLERGFAVVPNALEPGLLDELRAYSDERLACESAEHFDAFRFHGSMLQLDPMAERVVCRLVANLRVRDALRSLGFASPKWLSAYLISKPPRSPALWWHQDWWAWESDVSWECWPAQMFVMYYLRDVGPLDGALRVIPGSHRTRHQLHDILPPAHSPEVNEASEFGPAHAPQPGEMTVSVRAGDAVIGDSRLLHSTHANRSERRRTCLTLWYLPRFAELPDGVRSYVVDHPALPPRGWWQDEEVSLPPDLRELLPTYDGDAQPVTYNRTPPSTWPNAGPLRSAGRSSFR